MANAQGALKQGSFKAQQDSLKEDTNKRIDAAAGKLKTAADLKSGTNQDVLSSFFKLAFNDLKDGHQFNFNSSWFALKAKSNPKLFVDTNYKKQTFARNFEMGVGLSLDSSFKFKTTSVNIKYAIINNRDKDIFKYSAGNDFDNLLKISNELIASALKQYQTEMPVTSGEFITVLDYFYNNKSRPRPAFDALPKRFLGIINQLKTEKRYESIKGFDIENLTDSLKKTYKTVSDLMNQRSLWTVGAQLQTDWKKAISKADFNSEYLKGITNNHSVMGLELDIKANLSIYDSTVVSNVYHRRVFSSSAGINWIIYRSPKSLKSYVEFKPALTYNNVLGGQYTGETKSRFSADGVLRLRVTDDLWIPFNIKYDPDKKRFFGFLNITSNFDWLGRKSKTAN